MDDFPGTLPTMADLRSEDGISAPSSRNLSPVSQGPATLPIGTAAKSPESVLLGASSALGLSNSPAGASAGATTSSFGTPRPASAESAAAAAQKAQPVNTMPLPGARHTTFSGWPSPGAPQRHQSVSPAQHPPPPPQQQPASQQGFAPYGNANLSNLNPAFSGGIWMPIATNYTRGPPPQPPTSVNPFPSVSAPTFQAFAPPQQSHGYGHQGISYPTAQPRSPTGPPYPFNPPPGAPSHAYTSFNEPGYSAFVQPGSLAPFSHQPPSNYTPAQPHPHTARRGGGGFQKGW